MINPKSNLKKYQKVNEEKKQQIVKRYYNSQASRDDYATSRDFNLRELEILAICSHLDDNKQVLDVGCGNGYSILRFASQHACQFYGIDFSPKMIEFAQRKLLKSRALLRGKVQFRVGDVLDLKFKKNRFDFIISERCLLNLPSQDAQWKALDEIYRVLRPGGYYLMLEGTKDGLNRLNKLRVGVGLSPILDISEDNFSSLKFDEKKLENRLKRKFKILKKQYFGTYYLISRIVHPLLVAPSSPKFDSPINEIARKIAQRIPDVNQLGHLVLYVLKGNKK